MSMAERYEEIKELHKFCLKQGIDATLEPFFDGFAIRFPKGFGDFVQHRFSYGSGNGCVEPAIGSRLDYTAVRLADAKALVIRNRERLIGRADNGHV